MTAAIATIDRLLRKVGAIGFDRPWAMPASDEFVHPLVETWRVRTLNLVLPGVALFVFPVIVDILVNNALGFGVPWRWLLAAAYIVLGGLAVARRIDYRVRTWGMVALVLLLSALGTARTGAAGTGAFLLLGLPILALVLLGVKSGWIATAFSLAVYVVLTALARTGLLSVWQVTATKPIAPESWALQGLALAGMLLPMVVLLGRFFQLHATLLQNERKAIESLTTEAIERRRLERELVNVVERERKVIGQELHDGVCQQTAGAQLRVSVLASRAAAVDHVLSSDLEAIAEALHDATSDARRLARGLHPVGCLVSPLPESLTALATSTQRLHHVRCVCQVDEGAGTLPQDTMFHVYKIAQEAVSNAVRHAHATRIDITMQRAPDAWQLSVRDDGTGLKPDHVPGLGLQIMEHRAQLAGGTFAVDVDHGKGTTVICSVPHASVAMAEGASHA